MELIIDRFEGNYIVCEKDDGGTVNISGKDIPDDAKEGDVLKKTPKGYVIDEKETQRKREEIEKLMEDVFEE